MGIYIRDRDIQHYLHFLKSTGDMGTPIKGSRTGVEGGAGHLHHMYKTCIGLWRKI